MSNQALKVVFEQKSVPPVTQHNYIIQHQTPRYPDSESREIAIKQQQMHF